MGNSQFFFVWKRDRFSDLTFMRDLWWTKWHWNRSFFEFLSFSLSVYVSGIILSVSVCACEGGGVSMDVNNSSRH
jgi:hypothetical protein